MWSPLLGARLVTDPEVSPDQPADQPPGETEPHPVAPLDALHVLAVQEKDVGDGVVHIELFTPRVS